MSGRVNWTKTRTLSRDFAIVLAGCSLAWFNENSAELGGAVGTSPVLFAAITVGLQQGWNKLRGIE